jgi:hypothetical protein
LAVGAALLLIALHVVAGVLTTFSKYWMFMNAKPAEY